MKCEKWSVRKSRAIGNTFIFSCLVLYGLAAVCESPAQTADAQSVVSNALEGQLPPGVSVSDVSSMSSSEVGELEQQARSQGVSQDQIDKLKKQYGVADKSVTTQQNVSGSEKVKKIGFEPAGEEPPVNYQSETGKPRENPAAAERGSGLTYFGYSIFQNVPEAFKPAAVGPVDPGYHVGPGDALRLSVWGQVEFQYELTVDLQGKIFIPVAGQVFVAGLPFEQLQEKIKNLLSKHYSGLALTPPRTFLDLSVARLRPIRIIAMGEVQSPGGYTVSSYANAFNALYGIGGPLPRGSLRSISVMRDNKPVAVVDMYEYLLGGSCTTDVRLQTNDVVFVPPRGKTVAISGSVFRPAIYELKSGEHFQALLAFCGGPAAGTNLDRAHVFRIIPFDQRRPNQPVVKVIDIDLKAYLNKSNDFLLCDRDSIAVIPLSSDLCNYVRLSGAVRYPGLYQSDTITLRDLIFRYGKPIGAMAYTKRADLIRVNDDLVSTSVIPVDLDKLAADASHNRLLKPGDEVIVYDKGSVASTLLTVTVEGEVRRPGVITLDTNMTVIDALLRAGGFTKNALRTKADVYRPDRSGNEFLTRFHQVTLPESLDYAPENRTTLTVADGDRIVVRPDPFYFNDNFVTVSGLVKYQGRFALEKRETRLSEILDKAGGLMPGAFLLGGTIKRQGKRVVVDFGAAYTHGDKNENILLQKGDEIVIPPEPNSIYIYGHVNNQGLLGFQRGKRVSDYIARAGGFSDSAGVILFKKPNGETRKIKYNSLFSNPVVPDGSEIFVAKKPAAPPKEETKGPSIAEVIRDTLAIITSAVTVIVLVTQMQKS